MALRREDPHPIAVAIDLPFAGEGDTRAIALGAIPSVVAMSQRVRSLAMTNYSAAALKIAADMHHPIGGLRT